MVNWAIFIKSARDSFLALTISAVGLIAFVVLFVWAMINMGEELLQFVAQVRFVRRIMEMSFGIRLEGEPSINIMFAVSFTHAVVLVVVWGFLVASVTRVTVAEVERGTADLLLTMPVTRLQVWVSTSIHWFLSAIILSVCPWVGVIIGSMVFSTDEQIRLWAFGIPVVNFFALNLAISGATALASAMVNRRGVAITIVVVVALVSVSLNFLEPFIGLIEHISFLGLLHFYRPVDAVRTTEWPLAHIGVLLMFGLTCWLLGASIFCRKDIMVA